MALSSLGNISGQILLCRAQPLCPAGTKQWYLSQQEESLSAWFPAAAV